MKITASPVKRAAEALDISVIQDKARDPALADRLRALAPDVAVVVAYGSILPAALLEIPDRGFVNLHFSLLPAYRGAAPVQRAILNGEWVSGASIMVLTEGMDEGPVIASEELPIAPEDTTATYGAKLAEIGADLLVSVLPAYVDGTLSPVPQDDAGATYANKLTTDDARIDWSRPQNEVIDLIRALNPEPGAWTQLNGTRLKVFSASAVGAGDLAPGAIAIDEGRLMVGTGSDPVILDEVQPATKKRMSGGDLARGLHLAGSERMGE
jgi:methionyl-tRNA formyltransferase